MELNVNEPLMKHRYCYQVTSEIGLRLRSMIKKGSYLFTVSLVYGV